VFEEVRCEPQLFACLLEEHGVGEVAPRAAADVSTDHIEFSGVRRLRPSEYLTDATCVLTRLRQLRDPNPRLIRHGSRLRPPPTRASSRRTAASQGSKSVVHKWLMSRLTTYWVNARSTRGRSTRREHPIRIRSTMRVRELRRTHANPAVAAVHRRRSNKRNPRRKPLQSETRRDCLHTNETPRADNSEGMFIESRPVTSTRQPIRTTKSDRTADYATPTKK
jgi:hypothetical protein